MSTTHPTTQADARFWDRAARGYAKSPIKDMTGYERTLARVAEHVGASDHVLELGCGTGSTALRLAPRVRRYHATDLAPEMVAIANEKLAAEPQQNLTFAAATAAEVPVPEGGYDAVLAFNLLHLVEDLDATLVEIRDCLRPGGVLIAKTALIKEMNVVIRGILPLMRVIGKAPKSVGVFGESALIAAMTRAGLTVEAVERHGAKGKDVRCFTVARRA